MKWLDLVLSLLHALILFGQLLERHRVISETEQRVAREALEASNDSIKKTLATRELVRNRIRERGVQHDTPDPHRRD